MLDIPILLLGFNRPDKVRRALSALEKNQPKVLLCAVDGPREGNAADLQKVKDVQFEIENLSWKVKLETRFRSQNLGIRQAIPDAVSWAISNYGRVIVVEDDAVPGPEFYGYMTGQLTMHDSNSQIGHVSGYTQVPERFLSQSNHLFRGSKYPESYAWATWDRAWKFYSDEIYDRPEEHLASYFSRAIWRENFNLAEKELVSTWAFRWVASLWRNNLICTSPNRNITTYAGQDEGTHTRRKPRAAELPIKSIKGLLSSESVKLDERADDWVAQNLFRENALGVVDLKLAKYALTALKKFK